MAGVFPSVVSTFGGFTPFTGLLASEFTSHRYSNNEDSAANLRRIDAPDNAWRSSSAR